MPPIPSNAMARDGDDWHSYYRNLIVREVGGLQMGIVGKGGETTRTFTYLTLAYLKGGGYLYLIFTEVR